MPGLFKGVTLPWAGAEYTVPAERQLRLIADLEDMLRGPRDEPALEMLCKRGGPGMVRLSQAWGHALRYAGADVTDEDVYGHVSGAVLERDPERLAQISAAIGQLMSTILPPADSPARTLTEMSSGKKTRPASGAGKSKGSTKRQSARAGSARKASGG